ncbi:MAG: sensor domain-containing phosphodiesterase [Gordonibacter sp.]
MQNVLDSLLDGLSELIYISDPVTYKLLYINQAGKEAYGADSADGSHYCYAVLQGREEPCPFCTNDRLSYDSFFEWEFTNNITGRHYLLRDKLIEWNDGEARLEVAFDVTERQRESESFRFLGDAGVAALDCIRVLEGGSDLGGSIDEAIRILGTFLEADRTYIFEIDGAFMSNTYEWCRPGVLSQRETLQNMPVKLVDQWIEYFKNGRVVLVKDIECLLGEHREEEYEVLKSQDIRSLVAVALEIDGEFVGYIGVDNPQRGEHLELIEKPLLALASFASARMRHEAVQKQVAELTWNDSLTCACSRAAFHRDFDRGSFESIGMALVDADRLTLINREQGRPAGDKVLRRIAGCLREVFGEGVYRIGDDEFCAVVEKVDYKEFAELVERAAQRFLDEGLPASLGPAWRERCVNAESLLDLAGDRMRSAKRGRHRATDLGVDLASDAAVSNLLRPGGAREAVRAGLFTIYLMPQASSATGEIVGAEALIRFRNQERKLQALPSSFIPALEDMGEISSIDFFALSEACATVSRWQQEGRTAVPIAVNFSRRTIGDKGFAERVAEVVASYDVDPWFIEIEITESAREDDSALLRRVADGLRSGGFRVAIDDFGVENANFALFTQLMFNVLKIDKSLVWGLGSERHTMKIIRGLVNLCDDLGIETVAEGIETEEQYRALREAGCTRAQGYRLGKPQPIDEFERRFFT